MIDSNEKIHSQILDAVFIQNQYFENIFHYESIHGWSWYRETVILTMTSQTSGWNSGTFWGENIEPKSQIFD